VNCSVTSTEYLNAPMIGFTGYLIKRKEQIIDIYEELDNSKLIILPESN